MKNELMKIKEQQQKRSKSFDEELRKILMTKTLGEIVILAEACSIKRTNAICTTIFNAIFGTKENLITKNNKSICKPDIGVINEIIKRIDGVVPDSDDRENYANIIGDAIEGVFDRNESTISFNDLAIDAMAKAILMVALREDPKMSDKDTRDRQRAIEIWFSRTGGRKTKPEQINSKILYVDRDFTKSLDSKN